MDSGRTVWQTEDNVPLAFLVTSPDGRWLASVERRLTNEDGKTGLTFRVWKTSVGKERLVAKVMKAENLTAAAFSRDGRIAVATLGLGSTSGKIQVWDLKTSRVIATMESKPALNAVRTLAFSPDGRMLASGGENNAARLWEVSSGLERYRYAYGSKQHAVAFSPSGSTLAYVSIEAPVMLWDVWGTRTETHPKPNPAGLSNL